MGEKYKKHFLAVFVAIFIVFSTVVSPLGGTTVYADHPGTCTADETKAGATQDTDNSTNPPKVTCKTATPAGQQGTAQTQSTDTGENCAIEKIGWMLCPIISGASKLSDKVFDVLANNFLQTDPQLLADATNGGQEAGTKQAWNVARNLANIMFIMAFLAIIISQVTGYGINNYGIKKMIPRLIVAAIAVNVSYYICQLVVDLTNILGYEVQNTLEGIANSIGPSVFGEVSKYGGADHSTGGGTTILTVIAAASLGVAAFAWVSAGFLISIAFFVLITVITIVIILLLRKALIVLLVVISPIAFVMYLLPNTERLFNRWLKMFWQLLMVFPVVGLLFGAGQLASTIILVSGTQTAEQADNAMRCQPDDRKQAAQFQSGDTSANGAAIPPAPPNTYTACGAPSITVTGCRGVQTGKGCNLNQGHPVSVLLGMVATGIAVAPLLAVWSVLKGALNAAGAIGGKISSMGGKLAGGRLKAASEANALKRQQNATNYMQGGMRGRMANLTTLGSTKRGLRRKAVKNFTDSTYNKELLGYTADNSVDADGNLTSFGRKMAGGRGALESDMQRVASNALSAQRQMINEETKAAHTVVDTMDVKSLGDMVTSGQKDDPKTVAALERLIQLMGPGHMLVDPSDGKSKTVLEYVGGSGPSASSRALAENMGNYNMFGAGDIAAMQEGTFGKTDFKTGASTTFDNAIQSAISSYTADAFAGASFKEKGFATNFARANGGAAAAKMAQLKVEIHGDPARGVAGNDNLKGKVGNFLDTF